ncbi:MAG: YdcF family protein [Leptolyngbya sp. SIO4C5]|uniref:YdcF family protein n=1 Tax=Sphaerothrix gracilis TaxID=3151835 RepID=UPI0013BEDE48|nr:YdcF family protein [Leptolyngbya sp. SIO4C5]
MLLVLLTRILLWAAVGLIIWYVLLKFIPRNYLTWFGGLIFLALLVLSFVETDDPTVAIIWNIISFPLKPLGAAITLMAVALSQGVKKVSGNQVALALTILLIASMPLVARFLVGQAEQSVQEAFQDRRTLCEDICPADIPEVADLNDVIAIVVLGDSADTVNQAGDFPSQLDNERPFNVGLVPRLIYGTELYRDLRNRGVLPFFIVTAGSRSGNGDERAEKDQAIRQLLTNNGVPPDLIRIENSGSNVRASAEDVREFLRERELFDATDNPRPQDNRVIVIAPALTMRRVGLTFENIGLQVVARPTDFYISEEGRSGDLAARLQDIIPSVEALRLTTLYWEEFLSSIYYFLRDWLPPFDVSWGELVEV